MQKVIDFLKKIFIYIKEFILKIIYRIKDYFKSGNYKKVTKFIKEKSINFLGFITSIFSSIIPRKKESNLLAYINKIDKKIEHIEKSIENETSVMVIKIYKKDIDKKITKLQKLENVKVREDIKLINNEIEKLEKVKIKVEKVELSLIDKKNENEIPKEKPIKKLNPIKLKIKNREKSIKIKESKLNKTLIKKESILKTKIIPSVTKTSNTVVNKIKKGVMFTGAVIFGTKKSSKKKEMKENVSKKNKNQNKEMIILLKKLNNEINDTYNKIAYISNNKKIMELRLLKDKVLRLKREYLLLSRNQKFRDLRKYRNISSIDPNHLVYHDKAIDDLIHYLENAIKEETKKQNKTLYDKNEITLIKNSIKNDIELSEQEILKIKKEMKNIPIKNKRVSLLNKLSNFFRYSIKVGISLIPFGIFKNKLLATLTSGIILNNKIKSMKAIMNNEEAIFINYENILQNVNSKKTCLENTNYVLTNTIEEIDLLKNKIKLEFIDIKEKEKLLSNLDETKVDLLDENKKIENMLEQINNINGKKIKKKLDHK